MFHEVAFPFRRGQPHRHNLLAVVHRLMASAILRSVRHSFTSTESYLTLLRALGSNKTPIDMLRICSNVPPESFQSVDPIAVEGNGPNGLFTIGVFSSFGAAICRLLEPVIRHVLENPRMSVLLIGPAGEFHASLVSEYPEAARRIKSTGRLHVTQVGGHMRSCDVLLQLYPGGASAARGTLIGALASGIPVVTTAGPATDRLLSDRKTILFSGETPRSIRSALELLMVNRALGRELGSAAQHLYEESFQPAAIVSQLRNVMSTCENGGALNPESKASPQLESH